MMILELLICMITYWSFANLLILLAISYPDQKSKMIDMQIQTMTLEDLGHLITTSAIIQKQIVLRFITLLSIQKLARMCGLVKMRGDIPKKNMKKWLLKIDFIGVRT